MKSCLFFLAVFCLMVGGVLSINASTNAMASFMFAWGVISCIVFGALGVAFPEK